MHLSGLEGLVTYFQLVKIILWKCKHKKNPLNSLLTAKITEYGLRTFTQHLVRIEKNGANQFVKLNPRVHVETCTHGIQCMSELQ